LPETQATGTLPGILAEIVASKRQEIADLQLQRARIDAALADAPAVRDFHAALATPDSVSLIAECKRRSPGAGPIRPGLDPVDLTRGYEEAGARALSVLTDEPFFGGTLDDLEAIRAAVGLPILRKDFTLDALQIREARAAGADAVLLIVRILTDDALIALLAEAESLGMAALVEAHDPVEVDRAVAAGARILGINNRDLSNFTTDLRTTVRLLDRVPRGTLVVAESGIRTPDDVRGLGEAGVDAILVGETLLKASDPSDAAHVLAHIPRLDRVTPGG